MTEKCSFCGMIHSMTRCPQVKAFEYYPDGSVKRVEFVTHSDFLQPVMPRPLDPIPAPTSSASDFFAKVGR